MSCVFPLSVRCSPRQKVPGRLVSPNPMGLQPYEHWVQIQARPKRPYAPGNLCVTAASKGGLSVATRRTAMLAYALVVFAIGALGGVLLATYVLRGRLAPWALSLLHAGL